MPGPLPKKPELKQGKVKRSTRALLPAPTTAIADQPKLPEHPLGEKWHKLTLEFWAAVWRSPMATQYLEADLYGLFRMAVLTDWFFKVPTINVSAELRQLSMSYGLAPIDRRRLEWTIAKTEQAVEQVEHKRARRGRIVDGDPRETLEQK